MISLIGSKIRTYYKRNTSIKSHGAFSNIKILSHISVFNIYVILSLISYLNSYPSLINSAIEIN